MMWRAISFWIVIFIVVTNLFPQALPAFAEQASIQELKTEIDKLLTLPADIPARTRLQITQISRESLNDTQFKQVAEQVLRERGLTSVQDIKSKISEIQQRFQIERASLGASIPKPPSIIDARQVSQYNPFSQDLFDPIKQVAQQLPAANPARKTLDAITVVALQRATISLLKDTLKKEQRNAFTAIQLDTSSASLKKLEPFLSPAALKSISLSKITPEEQAKVFMALQSAVKTNLELRQSDLTELKSRTEAQAKTALLTLCWAIRQQEELIAKEEGLKSLQIEAQKGIANLQKLVGEITIPEKAGLPTDFLKLQDTARNLSTKEAGLNLLKIAIYGRLADNSTVKQIETGIITFNQTINAATGIKEQFKTVIQTQATLGTTLSNYAKTGSNILELAATIPGIDPKALEDGKRAFDTVTVGIDLAGQLASGNFVAAIGSIGGLFGGGGSPFDSGAARHQQVVSMLTGIQKRLDLVLENQNKMMESLNELHNKIDKLTEAVQKNHVEVMEKLDVLHEEVLRNRKVMIQIIKSQTNTCSSFLEINDSPTYANRVAFFKNDINGNNFASCNEGLTKLIGDPNQLNALFALELNLADTTFNIEDNNRRKITDFLAQTFSPFVDFATCENLSAGQKCIAPKKEQLIAALLRPSSTYQELQTKGQAVTPLRIDSKEITWFRQLLNVQATTEFSETAVLFSPYLILLDDDKNSKELISPSDIRNVDKYRAVGIRAQNALRLLKPALTLLNIGVAQQALFAGDILLPNLYENLDDSGVRQYIAKSPLLAKNLLLYYLHRQLPQPTASIVYELLWDGLSRDPANGLNSLITTIKPKANTFTFELDPDSKKWLAVLAPDIKVALPTPEEFSGGQFEQTPEFYKLAYARDRVASEIASIQLAGSLGADKVKSLALISILN